MKDLLRAVDQRIDRKAVHDMALGVVQSVGPTEVRVLLNGNATAQTVQYDVAMPLAAGDNVVLFRPNPSARWVIFGTFATLRSGLKPKAGNLELAPPSDFRIIDDAIAGAILATWNVPPQAAVAFELQSAATSVSGVTATVVVTRGAYGIDDSGTPKWLRVRSISDDWRYSSWSDWQLGLPGSGSGVGGGGPSSIDDLSDVDTDTAAPNVDDILVWDGANWVPGAAPAVTPGVDIQVFTASGVWTKPAGAVEVEIYCISGGGGGGSGRKDAAGGVRTGGSGGGSGALAMARFSASDITSPVNVIVGAGGAGGNLISGNSAGGNPGQPGGETRFGSSTAPYVRVAGGAGGSAGNTSTASAAAGASGVFAGGNGGSSTSGIGSAGSAGVMTAGGGGGGGMTNTNLGVAGGAGGVPTVIVGTTAPAGGAAGSAGNNGATPNSAAASPVGGTGGSGGGSSHTSNAGAGGAGGLGSGGGGGGSATNSVGNSGAGGAGGGGICVVITRF